VIAFVLARSPVSHSELALRLAVHWARAEPLLAEAPLARPGEAINCRRLLGSYGRLLDLVEPYQGTAIAVALLDLASNPTWRRTAHAIVPHLARRDLPMDVTDVALTFDLSHSQREDHYVHAITLPVLAIERLAAKNESLELLHDRVDQAVRIMAQLSGLPTVRRRLFDSLVTAGATLSERQAR